MKISGLIKEAIMLLSISLASCGNSSIESDTLEYKTIQQDAKKLAGLQCEVMQLVGKASAGNPTALMESEKFNEEAEKVSRELKDKYTIEADWEKFAKAYEEALGDCE